MAFNYRLALDGKPPALRPRSVRLISTEEVAKTRSKLTSQAEVRIQTQTPIAVPEKSEAPNVQIQLKFLQIPRH